MSGRGGMLGFALDGDLDADLDAMKEFLPHLRIAHRAANLGEWRPPSVPRRRPATDTGRPTIAAVDGPTSHAEERAVRGIPEGLVRYSAGIESADDLLADLDHALAAI